MTKTLCRNRARVLHNGSGPPTCCLPKGLQGAADTDKDKSITVGEMKKYVSENVSYWAQRLHNRIQTPAFSGDERRVLARVR
jgi:hypothetical protein